ncbi:hypothetical protein BLNAU_1220 [Blattamonas nauphoetae]|uniref:Uncharacterized protein n=1 Tax=Blattamonas nauphoetae TaxID=2049346 RepID=A0ABQ9YIS9_9EUKA|nr:hypothetical protein BLNAU_1220 [Blattamonas nauphoetae]
MSRSMNTPLSFAATLALLVSGRQTSIDGWMVTIGGSFRSEGSEDVIAEFMAVLDSCSVATHTLPLPSASPSPPTPSHSPLPLPHHAHPPTLPLPHHPHPPTPLCLSVTTHTISLPCASPSPPTRSNLLFIFVLTTFLCIPWREIITVATMEMVKALTMWCSSRDQYALVQADLIPQLIITLSAQSLPVADAVDIHTSLLNIIVDSLWLSTPRSLAFLGNQDENGQQHVHETIMKQVVAPSEKQWIFILGLPVFLTIPCCLTFFEYDGSIWCFLHTMNHARWEWNKGRGEVQQMWKKVLRMLRMEGIEDVIEEKLEIDRNGTKGREIVIFSIDWNNLQGMNLSERE